MDSNNATFTYDYAKKYFENLDRCNSDNDCPENSYCIGNKCIVTFFCKKEDKSICSHSSGEMCYENKKSIKDCDKNEDCFGSVCDNGFCIEKEYICYKYSVGHFTFENGKNYFNKLDIQCNTTSPCPNYTTCVEGKCKGTFYCNKNEETCSFGQIIKDGLTVVNEGECNSDDECISNSCSKNYCKKVYLFDGKGFGLEDGNKCIKDEECHSNHCALVSGFKNACREPSEGEGVVIVFYLPFLFIFYCIIIVVLSCFSCRLRRYFNDKDKRKNEPENETEMELINKDQEKQD